MPGISNSEQDTAAFAERRAKTRTPVNPPIYADIENVNGGLVYNMTEDGIAMSAAIALRGDGPLNIRIQLPGAGGWIETIGQITWKSTSEKTAGIRFAGLPEETRQIIRDWLALERSKLEPEPGAGESPRARRCTSSDVTATTPVHSLPNPFTVVPVTESLPESIEFDPEELVSPRALTPFCERRVHPRHPITPLSHVEIGPDNRGMLLNISDGGLGLIVAMRLAKDDLPTIRIQFPDSKDPIEVCGKIAWLSESKREAGIRFVNLAEEARKKIALRISRYELPNKAHEKAFRLPRPRIIQPEGPELPKLKLFSPKDVPPEVAAYAEPQVLAASRPLVTGTGSEKTYTPIQASDAPSQKSSRTTSGQEREFHPLNANARTNNYARPTTVLTIAAVIVVATAGIATLAIIRTEVGGNAAISRPNMNKSNGENNPVSASKATDAPPKVEKSNSPQPEIEPKPFENGTDSRETRVTSTPPVIRGIQRTASSRPATNPVRRAENSLHGNLTAKLPESTATNHPMPPSVNSASQSVVNPPAPQKEAASAAGASSLTEVPSKTEKAAVRELESPTPSSTRPETSLAPVWSVTVSTDPYPSIRFPTNMSPQTASPGKDLQIGRAVSRVEPVYPEDAKRLGIEGTVRLHVIVGLDGEVKHVELASGPASLAKAATRAIREWRYSRTIIGSQPMETEQDVVVTFRLGSRPSPAN